MATRRGALADKPVESGANGRRRPSQQRARHTLQAVFDATARVLREEGEAALTTNRIAEVAGVSIGTLYQYFRHKEDIVLAMLSQERERVMVALDAVLGSADRATADPRRLVREFVRHYIDAFGTDDPARRDVVRMAWRLDAHDVQVQTMREASERIALHLQRLRHPQVRRPTPAITFTLTRLLAGTVRSAALEGSPLLGTKAFENELVNACWGVLRREAGGA